MGIGIIFGQEVECILTSLDRPVWADAFVTPVNRNPSSFKYAQILVEAHRKRQ